MGGDLSLPGRLVELCVPLKEVIEPVSAGITLGSHRVPNRHAIGYLRVANVRKGWIDSSDIAVLEEQRNDRPRYELVRGDVLVVEGHADPEQIGRAAIVLDEHSGLLYQNHLFRLRFAEVVPEFAVLWLNSQYVRSYWVTRCATSSGLYTINSKLLEEVPFPALSRDEQRRIVAAHAVVEWRISALERVRVKLKAAEAALSAEVFAKVDSLWPTTRLEDIATVAAGVTLGSEPVGDGTLELPYLRVANVLDGRIDTADVKKVRILRSQYERFALRKGDLLLTEGGDLDKLGRGAVWDGRIDQCLHQNHVFRVRCGEEMSPDFLVLYTSSDAGRAYFQRVGKQTTNLASINSTQVKQMPVPLPPLTEQENLLGPIRSVRSRLAVLDRQVSKLRVVQQGVVEDLLSGGGTSFVA
ncbi:restriction endonuclease subunit S [Streptomyces sp. NPDC058442]|uniref:restriction endonuclease subunit S n=1 Tax=Streptomyces sp. NPDC058442 TaxID=3346503 RepID=UPI003668E253